jgi:hypothetical protein
VMGFQKIREAYEFFLLRFDSVCRQSDYFVRREAFAPKSITCDCQPFNRICVSGMIYLKDWPYKVVSKQKKIDILVRATEHFPTDGSSSVYSNVHVNYLSITHQGNAKVVENIHYDFSAKPEVAHPFFHAQFANNVIDDESGRSNVGFDYLIDSSNRERRYKNMRVPTAHMNLPSVLVCLAADHMQSASFESLLKELRVGPQRLPEASCQRMRQAFAGGRDFCKSIHWY